jgi:PKD repeat protein
VARIAKPYSTSQSVCNGGSMTLHSSSTGGKIKWYDSKTSTTALDTGLSFTTPNLTQTKAYYVEEEVDNGTISGGKPDNSGGGGFLNYEQSLIFDTYQPFILHSVDVYSNNSSTIFVQLKNENNQIITSKPITVAQGKNTIILDFNIPAGNNLKLTGKNLFRNNQGVNYPYTVAGYLSIKKSSASTNPLKYYYYFYNWQIKKTPCKSERTEVFAFVNNAAPKADFSYANNDPYVSFTDLTQNQGTPLWKFGDGGGSSLSNPNHLYLQNGNYQVTLFVDNGCGTDSVTKPLTIGLATNLNNGSKENQVRVYPNPATGKLNINFGKNVANGYIYLIDITGRIVYYENVKDNTGKLTINLNSFNSGIYMIKIIGDKTIFSTKIIIE